MPHKKTVLELTHQLQIVSDIVIGKLMANRRIWTAGTSARNNSRKALKTLVDLGHLEEGKGYFRIPGCRSEYCDHTKALIEPLAEILKLTKVNL